MLVFPFNNVLKSIHVSTYTIFFFKVAYCTAVENGGESERVYILTCKCTQYLWQESQEIESFWLP